MPIYEYKCKVCAEHFEVEQSFTDETLTTIGGCTVDESGNHQVRKVFAAPAIAFKGDGFYRNDARSPKNGKGKSKAGTGESKTSDSTEKSTTSSESSSTSSSDSSPASKDKSLTGTTPGSPGSGD